MSAVSSTRRVIGPAWSSDQLSGVTPCRLTRPYVGFSPTMPQTAAGPRIDPPVSLPIVSGTMPAATAAPEPDDDPAAVNSRPHGFFTVPNPERIPLPVANSRRFSLPSRIAPAASSRSTSVAS